MRRLSALILLAACSSTPEAAVLTVGDATITVAADASLMKWSRKEAILATFTPASFVIGIVPQLEESLSYDPWWIGEVPISGLEWAEPTSASLASSDTSSIVVKLKYELLDATVTFNVGGDGKIRTMFKPGALDGGAVAFLRIKPRTSATEAYYGLGEWPDHVNQRGQRRPMQIEADLAMESATGLENHVPIPLLIGTNGWGLFVKSNRVGLFDVATKEPDLIDVTYGTADASGDGLEFHLFSAANPLDITRHYYDLTGDPLLPAPWALGPWIWRDENEDAAQVLDDAKQIRELDLATSGYWIDRPYATKVNTFDFDPALFPDPKGMIDELHAQGLRVAIWHTPYLEEGAEPQRAEATSRGYFVPKPGILLNKWSVPIDFTAVGAPAWWRTQLAKYTALGIEGYKLDYAEDVQVGLQGARNRWLFADGSTERTQHWQYQHDYHRTYAGTLPDTGGFLLCRAARWGDQKNVSVIWPGDMNASMEKHRDVGKDGKIRVGGLPATVVQGLTLGPSGFPFFGADTGGYRQSPPDRETFIRWFEQTALSTVMQVGNSASDTPWEFNEANGRDTESLDLYRQYARLHLRLFPYEWTYAQNLKHDGRPIQRPFGLVYPELGVHPDDTYFFGDSLLVAPVVTRGQVERKVLVPPGDWFDWWTGKKIESGERTLPAPIGTLPLLIKGGGIVPLLRPTIDTLAPATAPGIESFANDAGILWVRIAPGNGTFRVYDGTKVTIAGPTIDVDTSNATVFTKGLKIELIATPKPTNVTGATEWRWDEAIGGTVTASVANGARTIRIE